jgi:tetratricopeptide (TPR) repeat protein
MAATSGETEQGGAAAIGEASGSAPPAAGLTVDFFISRRGASAEVAQEVATALEGAGHSVFLQDYDIPRGANFVVAMHEALKRCRHLVVLLTQDYDQSQFTLAEVSHFIAAAARAEGERRLVVLRVEDCNPEGLFAAHVFTDLVGVDDPQERRNRILAAAEGRATASKPRPRIFERVPARDPNFTGRDQSLAHLHHLLREADPSASVVQVAVHTLGGTGKTALATEYAHRHAVSYSGVWWARAEGRTLLIASLAELAGRLEPSLADEPDQEKAARAGLARLARSALPFLLVYDNVDTPETLRDLVPTAGTRILITSRWADWMGRAIEMKLDLFGADAATEFMQKRAGRTDAAGAARLAAALGHLPLALDHAGAYCRLTGSSFDSYHQKIDTRIARAPTGAAYPASVAATFGLAIEQIVATHPQAETLLGCFAFLAPEHIPLDLVAEAVADEDERAEALMALAGVSLVEHKHAEAPAVSVHRLVQAATRARLADRQAAHAERATLCLAQAFPELAYGNPNVWPQCAMLLPHVLALADCYRAGKHEMPEAGGRLFDLAAGYLHARGAYGEAEPLFRTAVAVKERVHGRGDPRFANALGNLALLLQETGRTDEAESHYREVIATEEKALGREHPDLARSLNNLANLLQDTGRSAEAEPLLREAIAIKERLLGSEHPSLATSLNNLANVLRSMGRTAESEPLYRGSMAIQEKAFGRDHPHVATSRHNLGVVLREAGRYDEAEPLLRDAVAIWSATLGSDHPQPARGKRNLAVLLLAISRAEDALASAQAAFETHEKTLAAGHAWRIDSALTCAEALAALGRHAESDELRRRYGT